MAVAVVALLRGGPRLRCVGVLFERVTERTIPKDSRRRRGDLFCGWYRRLPCYYLVGIRILGGVNHCRLHCRLAKSRGLMRRG